MDLRMHIQLLEKMACLKTEHRTEKGGNFGINTGTMLFKQ